MQSNENRVDINSIACHSLGCFFRVKESELSMYAHVKQKKKKKRNQN